MYNGLNRWFGVGYLVKNLVRKTKLDARCPVCGTAMDRDTDDPVYKYTFDCPKCFTSLFGETEAIIKKLLRLG